MERNMGSTKRNAQESYENTWLADYGRFEADREFGRARRRTLLRNAVLSAARFAAGISGRDKSLCAGQAEEVRTNDGILVPIAAIIGVIDRDGRRVPSLPMMSRAMLGEWRRLYALDSDDALPSLAITRGVGGWYLEGGAPALVLLEVLKAKGRMTARVSMAPQPEAEQCRSASAMEECDECPTEMAGIAG